MENKQTALQWFEEQSWDLHHELRIGEASVDYFGSKYQEILTKALAMEKEQKRLDYIAGHDLCRCVTDNTDEAKECFEEYYNLWKK